MKRDVQGIMGKYVKFPHREIILSKRPRVGSLLDMQFDDKKTVIKITDTEVSWNGYQEGDIESRPYIVNPKFHHFPKVRKSTWKKSNLKTHW